MDHRAGNTGKAHDLETDRRVAELTREELEVLRLDLKTTNPNRKSTADTRSPEQLLDIVEAKGREIEAAIADLRASLEHHV